MDIAGTYWGAKTNTMVKNGATGIHVRAMHGNHRPVKEIENSIYSADYSLAWLGAKCVAVPTMTGTGVDAQ